MSEYRFTPTARATGNRNSEAFYKLDGLSIEELQERVKVLEAKLKRLETAAKHGHI